VPCSRITLTLEDRQLLPFFQGVPAYDIVKVILEDDTAETSMYFGKCVVFLRDSNMMHYVLLHWFTRQEPATGFNVVSNVPSFKLARMDQTLSYSVVPVECILNGGVLLPGPQPQIGTAPRPDACYWALLSPITRWSFIKHAVNLNVKNISVQFKHVVNTYFKIINLPL
jgi:hypothetical protein